MGYQYFWKHPYECMAFLDRLVFTETRGVIVFPNVMRASWSIDPLFPCHFQFNIRAPGFFAPEGKVGQYLQQFGAEIGACNSRKKSQPCQKYIGPALGNGRGLTTEDTVGSLLHHKMRQRKSSWMFWKKLAASIWNGKSIGIHWNCLSNTLLLICFHMIGRWMQSNGCFQK